MIEDISKIQIGSKVYYQPEHYIGIPIRTISGKTRTINKYENGIVKEVPDNNVTAIKVVYDCNGDWENYKNYTSALTDLRDLNLGWCHE